MQIIRKICNIIERKSIPGINWTRTLYFNFRLLPFNQARKLPVLIYGKPVFNCLSGSIVFECPIKRGLVKINQTKPFAPSLQTVNSQINLCGTLIVRGDVMIGCGTKIGIVKGAVLDLGKNTKITDFCNIDCCKHIVIGDGTTVVHRCQIMDSNHHYVLDANDCRILNNTKPIHIGKQCWICNSSTIQSGTKLPDFTIVASNSLVGKDFTNNGECILIGGIPAKLIKNNIFRIYNDDIELALNNYFSSEERVFYKIEESNIDLYKNLLRRDL